jgi:hypothetical protein
MEQMMAHLLAEISAMQQNWTLTIKNKSQDGRLSRKDG